jgi:hypothetical protein
VFVGGSCLASAEQQVLFKTYELRKILKNHLLRTAES